MKVYWTHDEPKEKDETFEYVKSQTPKECLPYVEILINMADAFQARMFHNGMEAHKYKVMWDLRSIEQEIEGQTGMILIESSGRIELKGFSAELTETISRLLKEGK